MKPQQEKKRRSFIVRGAAGYVSILQTGRGCSLESRCYPSAGGRRAEKRLRHSAALHSLIRFFHPLTAADKTTKPLLVLRRYSLICHLEMLTYRENVALWGVCCSVWGMSLPWDSSLALYCPLPRQGFRFRRISEATNKNADKSSPRLRRRVQWEEVWLDVSKDCSRVEKSESTSQNTSVLHSVLNVGVFLFAASDSIYTGPEGKKEEAWRIMW